jgi:Zn-finger protein
MQFFSSFCLTLSNYLLSGIQSTQLFAKHCLACQIIHSSELLDEMISQLKELKQPLWQ